MEINLVQGSKEWIEFRLNKVGASQIGAIMGVCPFRTRLDVYNEIKGIKTQPMTIAMQRGKDLESKALSTLEELTGKLFRPAVFQSQIFPWIASLDGISLSEDLIVEIKCPGKKSFEDMKKGIPLNYQYQMQWQMMVTGIKKCIFMVYSESEWYTHSLDYNPTIADELLECGRDFYENHILPSIPPEPEEAEPVFCNDPVLHELEELRCVFINEKKSAEHNIKEIDKTILEDFFDDTAVKGKIYSIKMQSRKGSLDENAMISDGIDLSKYRKPNVNFPVIKLLKEKENEQSN